jgi:EmrB/QacA subfamily drug resistance transporter
MDDSRRRWIALYVLCLGTLMIVLDSTIVNVALPSIRDDLGFSPTSLSFVVNAYMLTFGGLLLLGGRLGDLFGHRRMFISGIAFFTVASAACGLATSQEMLIAARAIQGVGGAIASAVGFSLVITLFTDARDRAKAMGIAGFVASGGGAVGVLLGGVLTDLLNWHWIFLVNVPIGIAVCILASRLVPASPVAEGGRRLDVAGAVTITLALMFAVYAIVNGNEAGWQSLQTVGLLAASVVLLGVFVTIESRIATPLVPLGLFKLRNLTTANIVGVLWAGGMFAWFFISALYLQLVLEYSPMEVGLAFLPANLIMAAFSISLAAKICMRFGFRRPMSVGLLIAGFGLLLFSRAPQNGSFLVDVLPPMLLLGIGAGIAFTPVLMTAMGDVQPQDAGLASGVVNTSFMMGGALGLAVLASLADSRTANALASGAETAPALLEGYQLAFIVGGGFAILASVIAAVVVRTPAVTATNEHVETHEFASI